MSAITRAIGALALAMALIAVASPAHAAVPQKARPNGFSEVAGCISGADHLLVSIVVDESLSLRDTDPRSLRVRGITTALDSLEQLAATVDESTSVQVSISTFARAYNRLVGWRELNEHTAQQMRTTAARTLPARDAGDATDYRQALLGAKKQLDVRQHELKDPNACKLLLWFTDGALDVDAQTDTASAQLCQVGGIADAVREDGIAVVALALFTPGAGVTQPQREQLRAVAEGRGSGVQCGTTPIPADSASGVYLPADDPAALQRLFAGAGALVAGGTEVGTVSCPGPQCRGGNYRLDIDQGVAGARLLVQSQGTPEVSVTSPSGKRLRLASGQTEQVDGAQVSYLLRDRLATINISFDPYTGSRSRWSIQPKGRSDLGVYWFWGAQLALESTEVKAGTTNQIAVRLLSQNGTPLPSKLYRNPGATLRIGNRDIDAKLTPEGLLQGKLDLAVNDLPSNLAVTASLAMRSKPSNVLLGPITISDSLPVTLPPSYPAVSPKELDFGHLEGIGTKAAALQLTGSQLGSTQVCVDGSSVTVPGQQPAEGLVEPSSECVSLKANEKKTLRLELSPTTTADGVATGEVRLKMSAADGSDDLGLAVPARLEMERRVDEGTRWALIAFLIGVALLIPAMLLIGSNLLLARFLVASTSRTATKSVKVTPAGLRPVSGTTLLAPEEFENASFSGVRKGRRMSLDNTGIRLGARRIVSLKEPQGLATGPSGQMLVSGAIPYRANALNEAPVALGEVDATFVIVNPNRASAEEADGTLVMVVPHNVDRQGIHDRASRMSRKPDWKKLLGELSESMAGEGRQPANASSRPTSSSKPIQAAETTAPAASHDSLPGLPWDWASEDVGATRTSEQPKKSRLRKAKKPRSAPSTPLQSSGGSGSEQDDDLPPLPDFLK